MNIGDYVRTKYGNIGKIIEQNDYNVVINSKNNMELFISKEDNIKSSSNIIDLIEYGDIVKYKIDNEEFISEVWGKKNDYFVQNFDVPIDLIDLNIVSVITHEQFSQMEYKVGD